MRIDPTHLLAGKLSVELKPFFKTLQVGQVLNALVQGRDAHGMLQLKVGTHSVSASTTSPKSYKPGETLKLIVIENREDIILQVLNRDSHQLTKPLIQQLLRNTLPHQAPPTQLLEKLNTIKGEPTTTSAASRSLPQAVIRQIVETIHNLSDRQSITTGQGLKQAIQNSGLFLEAKLVASLKSIAEPAQKLTDKLTQQAADVATKPELAQTLNRDLKAGLLRIIQVLEQTLPAQKESTTPRNHASAEANQAVNRNQAQVTHGKSAAPHLELESYAELDELRRVVDSSLARIQVNQTKAIVTEESQMPLWVIDLPFLDEQEVRLAQMRIAYEEGAGKRERSGRTWQVNITLELEELGKIDVRLTMSGNEISSSVWAANSDTYQLLTQNIDQLSAQLQRAGLKVDAINCFPGAREQSTVQLENPVDALVSFRI